MINGAFTLRAPVTALDPMITVPAVITFSWASVKLSPAPAAPTVMALASVMGISETTPRGALMGEAPVSP